MTHLREHMYRGFESHHVDVLALASHARREGGRVRRRRRHLEVAGTALGVVVAVGLGVATMSLAPRGGSPREHAVAAWHPEEALQWTAQDALVRTLGRVVPDAEVRTSFVLRYEGGASEVPLNQEMAAFAPPGGQAVVLIRATIAARPGPGPCASVPPRCSALFLPDGSLVRSWQTWHGRGGRRVDLTAERLLADAVVTVYVADDLRFGRALLSEGQLIEALAQPEWAQLRRPD